MRRPTLISLCLLACSRLLWAQEPGQGAVSGPAFGQRSLYILHLPLLDFGPARRDALRPGQTEWTLESAYANTYSQSGHAPYFHTLYYHLSGQPFQKFEADTIHATSPQATVFFVDGEVLRTALTARLGVSQTLFVSVEVPYLSYGAFSADPFVRGFHRAFGFAQEGRDAFPNGEFVLMLQQPYGPMQFDNVRPESGFGDVVTTLSWRPALGLGGLAVGADLAGKAPTGSAENFRGSGSWDTGLLVYVAKDIGRWAFTLQLGELIPGSWRAPIVLSTKPFTRAFFAITRQLGQKTFLGASFTLEQSPFRGTYGDVTRPGGEVALGAERSLGQRWKTRLTFTEHIPAMGDRADVGFALGVVHR